MKHIELLSLLCKNKKLLDEAYKQKRLLFVPSELVEIGLFSKVGGYYYLNDVYLNFVDTLLARADFSYVAEDFDKELKKLLELKEDYRVSKNIYLKDAIFSLLNRIYQGMKNRDKKLLSLIENLEGDDVSELDVLIKEAKRILTSIEEIMQKNSQISKVFEEFEKFDEFGEFVGDALVDVIKLNQNIDLYLKRIKEFISQSEKKRKFNQKLNKVALMILKEDKRIDEFLASKRFVYKGKISPLVDTTYLNYQRAKEIIGSVKKEKSVKKISVKKDLKEVVELINLKELLDRVKGSEDIFKTIIEYIGKVDRELLNESVRVFVYILNEYDKELIYTDEFNEFNVRVVRWRV
jgi:hypothetical protein